MHFLALVIVPEERDHQTEWQDSDEMWKEELMRILKLYRAGYVGMLYDLHY